MNKRIDMVLNNVMFNVMWGFLMVALIGLVTIKFLLIGGVQDIIDFFVGSDKRAELIVWGAVKVAVICPLSGYFFIYMMLMPSAYRSARSFKTDVKEFRKNNRHFM